MLRHWSHRWLLALLIGGAMAAHAQVSDNAPGNTGSPGAAQGDSGTVLQAPPAEGAHANSPSPVDGALTDPEVDAADVGMAPPGSALDFEDVGGEKDE